MNTITVRTPTRSSEGDSVERAEAAGLDASRYQPLFDQARARRDAFDARSRWANS